MSGIIGRICIYDQNNVKSYIEYFRENALPSELINGICILQNTILYGSDEGYLTSIDLNNHQIKSTKIGTNKAIMKILKLGDNRICFTIVEKSSNMYGDYIKHKICVYV